MGYFRWVICYTCLRIWLHLYNYSCTCQCMDACIYQAIWDGFVLVCLISRCPPQTAQWRCGTWSVGRRFSPLAATPTMWTVWGTTKLNTPASLCPPPSSRCVCAPLCVCRGGAIMKQALYLFFFPTTRVPMWIIVVSLIGSREQAHHAAHRSPLLPPDSYLTSGVENSNSFEGHSIV